MVRRVWFPLEMLRVVVIEIKGNSGWLLAAMGSIEIRVAFKCARLCPMVLNGSLRVVVCNVVIRHVSCIPGAAAAFGTEIPCFIIVFTSRHRIIQWITNPMR